MSNIAIILAGGNGTRVGFNCPKQFIEVCGKPIIFYTVKHFQDHSQIDSIVLVCIDTYKSILNEIIIKEGFTKVVGVVSGGENFLKSVLSGVSALTSFAKGEDNILIHYGASPFVDAEIITDAIRVCTDKGNACPAMPLISLSAAYQYEDSTNRQLSREEVVCLNSPQAIKYANLLDILSRGKDLGLLEFVDPHITSLMLALGERIYYSLDKTSNIKITTIDDVKLFDTWCKNNN